MEAVADPRFSQEVLRAGGFWFDLLPKLIDEDAEVLHFISVVRPPGWLQVLRVGNGEIGIAGEITEEIKLLGGQARHFLVAGIKKSRDDPCPQENEWAGFGNR